MSIKCWITKFEPTINFYAVATLAFTRAFSVPGNFYANNAVANALNGEISAFGRRVGHCVTCVIVYEMVIIRGNDLFESIIYVHYSALLQIITVPYHCDYCTI